MDEAVEGRFSFDRYVMAVWVHVLGGAAMCAVGVGAALLPENPTATVLMRCAIGVPCSLLGIGLFVWCVVQYVGRTSRLRVGPDGASWVTGGRPGSAVWTDVREVYREDSYIGSPGREPSEWTRRAHVRVVFQNGTEVIFRQTLSNYDALVHAIQRYAADGVFPAKIAEIAARGEAAFGSVAVGPEGLRVEGRLYPWAETNYAVSRGWLCVAPNKDDFPMEEHREIALSTLPNYVALLVLMSQIGKPPVDPLLTYPVRWRANMARWM